MIVRLDGFQSAASAKDKNGRFTRRVVSLGCRVNDARLNVQLEIHVNEEQSTTATHETIGY